MSESYMLFYNDIREGRSTTVAQSVSLGSKIAETEVGTFYVNSGAGLERFVFCLFKKDFKTGDFQDQLCMMLTPNTGLWMVGIESEILPMPCGILKSGSVIKGVVVNKPELMNGEYRNLGAEIKQLRSSKDMTRSQLVNDVSRVSNTLYKAMAQMKSPVAEIYFSKIDPALVFFNDESACYLGFSYISLNRNEIGSFDLLPCDVVPYRKSSREEQNIELVDLAMSWLMGGNDYKASGKFVLGDENDYGMRGSTASFIWSFFSDALQINSRNCLASENGHDFYAFFKSLDDYASSYSDVITADKEASLINPTRPCASQNVNVRTKKSKALSFVWWFASSFIVGAIIAIAVECFMTSMYSSLAVILISVICVLTFVLAASFTRLGFKILFLLTLCFSGGWLWRKGTPALVEAFLYTLMNFKLHVAVVILVSSIVFGILMTFLTDRYLDVRNDFYWRRGQ